ncbi:hypothetical protein [Nocardia cyriacigeorgica]|nr:hypothetical protein [Nocardia cyriacigeorgica]
MRRAATNPTTAPSLGSADLEASAGRGGGVDRVTPSRSTDGRTPLERGGS